MPTAPTSPAVTTSSTSPVTSSQGKPITSFDFAGALKSGATPQEITTYLSQNGAGALANTYFNQQTAQQPSGFSQGFNALKGFISSVAQPITEAAGSGLRALQATPKLAGAVGDAIEGNSANEATNLADAQKTMATPDLGQNTFAGNSNEQNLGEALKAGSLLVPGSTGTETVLGGALEGAGAGALQGAGQAGSENASNGQVAADAGIGAAAGGTIGAAIPAVGNALDSLGSGASTATEEGAAEIPKVNPQDTLKSRTEDVTPTYNKNMIGTYIKDADGKLVPRVEENENITGTRPVTKTPDEIAQGKEVNNIKNYRDNGTFLQKAQDVHSANMEEANALVPKLDAEDKADPLDTGAERQKMTDIMTKHIDPEEQAKFESGKTPKTPMEKYVSKVNEAVSDYDGTRAGKLELRQKIDAAYEDARGKYAFQSNEGNALDETNHGLRNDINKDLKATTNTTDTQASLDKQAKLYRAEDTLNEKAKVEGNSKGSRFLQKHPAVKFVGRVALRRLAGEPFRMAEDAVGVNALEKAIKP